MFWFFLCSISQWYPDLQKGGVGQGEKKREEKRREEEKRRRGEEKRRRRKRKRKIFKATCRREGRIYVSVGDVRVRAIKKCDQETIGLLLCSRNSVVCWTRWLILFFYLVPPSPPLFPAMFILVEGTRKKKKKTEKEKEKTKNKGKRVRGNEKNTVLRPARENQRLGRGGEK